MVKLWSATPVKVSNWYWWRSGPGKLEVVTYVDRNFHAFLFTTRPDGIHANNIGGEWALME